MLRYLTTCQYARTPKYALGSPLVPSRLRKRHDHHFEISSDQPRIDIGGISHGHSSVLDLYMPVLRTYPTENGRGAGSDVTLKYLQTCPPVEHIDVCTTWKGMSFAEAELLFQFHQVFKPSMEDLLADQLREQDQTFRRRHAKGTASKDRYSGTAKLSSRFSFNRTRLIESMLLRLQTSQEYMMHPPNRGFRRLLQLYLASCDCLVDIERTGSQNTAIDLLFQYPRPLLPEMPHELHVEAGWSPDFLTFQDLAIVPREGQELRIVPRYNSNAIFRTDGYHTDLRYSLETPLPWLTWDDEVQGFTGFVPPYSDVWGTDSQYGKVYRSGRVGPHAVVNQLRIEIKAQFTECFLPSLCLQRIVRTRLTFRVIPWWAVTNANAPDDQSVRPITPDTAQRYVDNLFDGGLSEEIDLRRTPAAQLQVRRVTGLSSPLDKDDLFSIRLNSQTPSFPSFTSRVDDEMDSISDLHSEKEETISSEESIISDKTTMQSASKTFVDMAIQIPRSYTKKDPLKSLQLAAEDRTRSSQSMASNLTIFTEGLGPDEDNLVLPGKPTESLPITFHNRYSLLHGLKENMYSNSNESDHDSVSCESAISSSETLPLDVHADKAINCRKQPEIRTTFQIGSWTGTLFRNSHGVAFPVQKDGLLLSEDNMSITSGTENSFGSGDHALEAMSNFGF